MENSESQTDSSDAVIWKCINRLLEIAERTGGKERLATDRASHPSNTSIHSKMFLPKETKPQSRESHVIQSGTRVSLRL